MSVGFLDLLTVIPQDKVQKIGIPFVRSLIEDGQTNEDIKKWDQFWAYFTKTWLPIVDSWNICLEEGSYKKLLNRTNNRLEWYNWRFDGLFLKNPSLLEFSLKFWYTTLQDSIFVNYKNLSCHFINSTGAFCH